jgi:hypothetical protein
MKMPLMSWTNIDTSIRLIMACWHHTVTRLYPAGMHSPTSVLLADLLFCMVKHDTTYNVLCYSTLVLLCADAGRRGLIFL